MATRIRQKAEKRAKEVKRPYAVAKYVRMSPSKSHIYLTLFVAKGK